MYQTLFGSGIPPALILIGGALFIPLMSKGVRAVWMLLLPLLALTVILNTPEGIHWAVKFMDFDLVFGRMDSLAKPFGIIFAIICFLSVMYALKLQDNVQHMCALFYAGGALGVTFAGDLLSLYIFWEIMAVASTFLILARKNKAAYDAAFHYILMHMAGGLILLAGIIIHYQATGGDLSFTRFHPDQAGLAEYLIMAGFLVNAAAPPLHAWLPDAYPEATVTGAVFLSAFTTKTAVYVLCRAFPGFDILAIIGAFMAVYGVTYALITTDARRILAYHIVCQIGYMVCAIGIGTTLAINGAVAHAYTNVIYKTLLFMGAGAVLQMAGSVRIKELGGLSKLMPLTLAFTIVGGISISAAPLTSGFISKDIILSAADYSGRNILWIMLLLSSLGTWISVGLKLPYYIWFGGKDTPSVPSTKEAPACMLIAMGLTALMSFYLGFFPDALYRILPHAMDYNPYTLKHLGKQLLVMAVGAWLFVLMVKAAKKNKDKAKPAIKPSDTDIAFIAGSNVFYSMMDRSLNRLNESTEKLVAGKLTPKLAALASDIPLKLTLALLRPFTDKTTEEEVKSSYSTGTTPLGLGAAAVVFLLIILFFFSG
ncbi:multicomponent Na+:H+ antiporter subunit D [Desulfobotulus alkaliphilus]|uniref:Multicomponent Na+:H+ antiporter subunit D n=1 Tax=Desulfobotulus alkaliphilus TaxID=622671 RepID=A0A562S8Q3_9BACT|nr:Na(+)/H(+) antiporter subunit D [Desulfobotulus alkaliphilus]TWI76840.1 multicomponent Na+:H+ antiporter subunit D [Desulfobotulus alkaliphilus]